MGPKKLVAYDQGLNQVSATKKECLGALRETYDGRRFRYAKAGGTHVIGGSTQAAAATSAHIAQIQSSGAVNAAGSINVSVYVGAAAVTANYYDDGYLVMHRGAAGTAGLYYPIASHEASAAGSEIITVTLKEPLVAATLLTDYFSLFCNPWSGIVTGTDVAVCATGQAMAAATSGQYFWVQTGGFSVQLGGDTAAVGTLLTTGTDDGKTLTYATNTAGNSPVLGHIYGTAAVPGYYTPIIMELD